MVRIWVLLGLLNFTICSSVWGIDTKKYKSIENSFYTVYIPQDWEPKKGWDGYIPQRRGGRKLYSHYLAWRSPIESLDDIPEIISFNIDSYEKVDGSELPMEEIITYEESLDRKGKKLFYDKVKVEENRVKTFYIRESFENGETVVYYRTNLYVLDGKMVHRVKITMREHVYKKKRVQDMIDTVLGSFKVCEK